MHALPLEASMSRPAAPNSAFERALDASGMSRKGLARRIRDLAAERGEQSSADHISVKRWLDGVQPRPETSILIVAALSERLGRTLTAAALGFTAALEGDARPRNAVTPVSYPLDGSELSRTLALVASRDLDTPQAHDLLEWDASAVPVIVSRYLFGHLPVPAEHSVGGNPINADAIRRTTAQLMDLDFQLGGGHTRKLLLFYFRDQVLPLFDALPSQRRNDLFVATAELAQMLGWSAYDAGRHGAAQRYFVHSLRLAKEAGDDLLAARLLANLSHQANYLGSFHNAVELARAAQHAAQRCRAGRTTAMLHAMEARALASLDDGAGCAAALHLAELSLDRAVDASEPDWISYFTPEELAGEAAHCFRDMRRPAETGHFGALAIGAPNTPARTTAFINLVTAAGFLEGGHVEQALTTARHAIELAGPLRSSRYQRYVRDFLRSAAKTHPRSPLVSDLVASSAAVLAKDMST
ncbi:hypothetical protein ACFFOU_15360 [Pseudonocardia sulfidoxydans]|uniref:hypothetical protein n=1 Tax=Pseudonocardia sulfidoxydans TaxID=54011 RepID=UPI0011BFB865|nr:hypothetical protein [Pseudonocardia sulfidoxydans]